ncbi:MAG: hypothetical protein CMO80_07515 [Verrucomicrobiales bacterium]|nr:hypothetical protein [Verrucomicrobiales bacterium]
MTFLFGLLLTGYAGDRFLASATRIQHPERWSNVMLVFNQQSRLETGTTLNTRIDPIKSSVLNSTKPADR